MLGKDQNRIFLCHASEDKEQVVEFYQKLKVGGFNPWLDKKDLLPGQDWDKEIRRALKNSRFIIIFFSEHSVSKRGYVQREFKLALDTLEEIPEGQIFVIPARLDNCQIPESFRHIHYVDLFGQEGYDLVVKVIWKALGVTSNPFTDPRDGQVYRTVELIGKIWMADNLNFDAGKDSWFYEDNPENGKKYGRLYTWETALKACPPGWQLPAKFDELAKTFESDKEAYKALIEAGSSGFNALLGGCRDPKGKYFALNHYGSYWSNIEYDAEYAWYYIFDGVAHRALHLYGVKSFALSCRCFRAI